MRIKEWKKYQHYRERRPIWIKLYRQLLYDREFHALSGDEAKTLFMCWMIAAEDEQLIGELPPMKDLTFKMRLDEKVIREHLSKLSHWIEGVDNSEVLASSQQNNSPKEDEIKPLNPEAYRLCGFMRNQMLDFKPDAKISITKGWLSDMDRLIRIDGRSTDEIEKVIRWATHDTGNGSWAGWAANIRSPGKLRAQFDKLSIQMRNAEEKERSSGPVYKDLTLEED